MLYVIGGIILLFIVGVLSLLRMSAKLNQEWDKIMNGGEEIKKAEFKELD